MNCSFKMVEIVLKNQVFLCLRHIYNFIVLLQGICVSLFNLATHQHVLITATVVTVMTEHTTAHARLDTLAQDVNWWTGVSTSRAWTMVHVCWTLPLVSTPVTVHQAFSVSTAVWWMLAGIQTLVTMVELVWVCRTAATDAAVCLIILVSTAPSWPMLVCPILAWMVLLVLVMSLASLAVVQQDSLETPVRLRLMWCATLHIVTMVVPAAKRTMQLFVTAL